MVLTFTAHNMKNKDKQAKPTPSAKAPEPKPEPTPTPTPSSGPKIDPSWPEWKKESVRMGQRRQ